MKIEVVETVRETWIIDLNLFHYSVFITPEWIESVASSTNPPIYFDFTLNGEIIAKISGIIIKRSNSKTYLYFYAGPALKELDENVFNKCLNALYSYAKSKSFLMVSIGSFDNKHSLKIKSYKFLPTKRFEFVVPLKNGIKNISMNNRFKRNVKKGKKISPQIKNSTDANKINILIDLLTETKKIRINKYNVDYHPFYLANLNKETLKKLLEVGIARIYYSENNGSIDCMEFNLERGNYVYMLLKGTNEAGYKHGMPSYLSYTLIKKYIEKGFSTYNQGGRPRSTDGDGLEIYKKSMGAEKIATYAATSLFLIWPYKLLNPLILLLRLLPKSFVDNVKKKFW